MIISPRADFSLADVLTWHRRCSGRRHLLNRRGALNARPENDHRPTEQHHSDVCRSPESNWRIEDRLWCPKCDDWGTGGLVVYTPFTRWSWFDELARPANIYNCSMFARSCKRGISSKMLNLRSRGRGFDSLSARSLSSGYYLDECLRISKPSTHTITNNKVNSAFYPSGVVWLQEERGLEWGGGIYLCRMAGKSV